ncbi:uncharacterized protein NPIL_160221 [Nephila pilipes]|uniref:Uncharacterized protein n=1 Tax=Nephila pilipes TaxID=299642 RepID=A0A8X6TQI4_NEPPI|nr:uncharacterized protein NPIL_160221 [Nephila pilipes]
MFSKIVILCAALAAAHASLVGPMGYGAPVVAAGPLGLGLGNGLIGAPAVATVSSQRTAINHVAPAGGLGLAGAGLGLARAGLAAAPLAIAGAPIAAGIAAAPIAARIAAAPIAVAAPVAAAAPIVYGNGAIAGNGILANRIGYGVAGPLALGNGLLGAGYGLGLGKVGLGLGAPLGLGLGKAIL